MRIFFTKAFLVLAIVAIAAFSADNTLGTWKLNIEKSKYIPAPMPIKSLNVTREASDGGIQVTATGELSNGTPISGNYEAKYDGKDVQVTGKLPYDTISLKQANANTVTDARKKTGGPYHATSRTVVSNGGKTMTTTTNGNNGDGKAFTSTFVFDKK
jgi:hypothetical protein